MEFPDFKKYFEAAQELNSWLVSCRLCPRQCGVNRVLGETGYCGAGPLAPVNIATLHYGEEPPISGHKGSGTVFFSGCTMHCVFCQNHQISRGRDNPTLMGAMELAEVFLNLESQGAHNINLVTPTPHLVVILKALALARDMGLSLPVVYNTSGYERVDTLKVINGLIEIYLPDYKYLDEDVAAELSDAEDYPLVIRQALKEMLGQVGHLALDDNGIAQKGLMVRHLVLPGDKSDTSALLGRLARICGPETWVSLMAQYTPVYKAMDINGLNRPINEDEYEDALRALKKHGLDNGYVQDLSASGTEEIPGFKSEQAL